MLFAVQRMQVLAEDAATPTQVFLGHGILGACVLALAWVVLALWREQKHEREQCAAKIDALNTQRVQELKELQDKRIEDAKTVMAQVMRVNETCVQGLTDVTEAMQLQTEAIESLRPSRGIPPRRS